MTEANASDSLRALSESLAKAVDRVGTAVVAIDARPRVTTSGIVWRDGVIVSTNHTVQRDEEIKVQLADGSSLPANLVGRDPSTDLAVLRIEGDQALGIDPVTTTADNTATEEEILAAVEAALAGLIVLPRDAFEIFEETATQDANHETAALDLEPLSENVTPRERQVLDMMAEGPGNKEIAWRLQISEHTVKFHVSSILAKLGASSRTEAVTQGLRRGLIMM